ncbi:MAG TPA: SBBP repeat-containing protein, partial [Bacteroidia bacterium]|nr:SBBP repeat-containing protein [Bacteroidia bacterium]
MKKNYSIFIILSCFACVALLPLPSLAKTGNAPDEKVNGWLNKTSPGFIENKGQVVGLDRKPVKDVLFKTSIKNADIYITTGGITYILKKQAGSTTNGNNSEPEEDEKRPVDWCRMDMKLLNATISKENIITEETEENGSLNYYLTSCPKGIMSVNTYDKITIKNIYPGIDWVLINSSSGLKYNFIAHPGANPNNITWQYEGNEGIKTASNNSMLTLETSLGDIQEGVLCCYQGAEANTISSSYKLNENILGFNLGQYNKQTDLTIDPPIDILDWATYYGGETSTHIGPRAICTDNAGNIYVTGYTDASLMPV